MSLKKGGETKVTSNRGDESSRHNESMSMYFAQSHSIFSPRIRADKSAQSFATKGSKTSRPQIFQSQSIDRNQLYLSKQFSGERTSSVGDESLHGGDSMVNIVEFEETMSPKRKIGEGSILSTPFKTDEAVDSKVSGLNFKANQSLI